MFGNDNSPQVDEDLYRGPKRDRSCTDILFCLAFVIFWGLTVFLTISQFTTGDFSRIARPYDSDGIACGYGENQELPYLYFGRLKTSLKSKIMERRLCIKECPKTEGDLKNCRLTKFWKEEQGLTTCAEIRRYETFTLWDRFCLPKDTEFLRRISKTFNGLDLQKVMEDVDKVKHLIVASIFASFLFCFVYSFFLEHCTWVIVIISFISFYAGCIYISVYSWRRYRALRKQAAEDDDPSTKSEEVGKFFKWIAYILWIVLAVISFLVCCLFTRIKLAVEVIMVSSFFIEGCGRFCD